MPGIDAVAETTGRGEEGINGQLTMVKSIVNGRVVKGGKNLHKGNPIRLFFICGIVIRMKGYETQIIVFYGECGPE